MSKYTFLAPLAVRFATGQPRREFAPGVHELTASELDHWFIKGCLKDGRIVPVADETAPSMQDEAFTAAAGQDVSAPVTTDDLMAMKAEELKALAVRCGISAPGGATKAQLARLILEGTAENALVMGATGVTIQA